MVTKKFATWASGFSGCDGGDLGTPESKSIWFCGIEWGGGHTDDEDKLLNEIFNENVENPSDGYSNWKENISYIFNWQAMKLLSAIDGGNVSEYKTFAELTRPFVRGSKGFFKMNLYPLAFKNTSYEHWKNGFANATGFETKHSYISWVRENRFPILKKWMKTYSPKLVICAGKSYIEEFSAAFADNNAIFNRDEIDEKTLYWFKNENGTVVVVIPFMVNRNGLTKNNTIQKFGERIRQLTFAP